MAKADKAATEAFADADLPVSVSKLNLLSSCAKTTELFLAKRPARRSALVNTARNLGVDFTLGPRRRTTVFNSRLIKALPKAVKIKKLLSTGAKTRRFAVTVVGSAIKYGCGVVGASDSQIRKRRALMHGCVVRRAAGRSATLDFMLTRGDHKTLDPAYFLSAAPIRDLASALWDGWVPRVEAAESVSSPQQKNEKASSTASNSSDEHQTQLERKAENR